MYVDATLKTLTTALTTTKLDVDVIEKDFDKAFKVVTVDVVEAVTNLPTALTTVAVEVLTTVKAFCTALLPNEANGA